MARNPYKHPALRRKRTTRKREFSLQLMLGSPGNRDKILLTLVNVFRNLIPYVIVCLLEKSILEKVKPSQIFRLQEGRKQAAEAHGWFSSIV